MNELTKIAAANQQRAREVIRDSGLEAAWRSVGAEPNLVGSLRTGLLMTRGSAYDGYFERVADRIAAVLTDRTRETILRLKYETPEAEKIMGIEYYQAVLRDGVGTYTEFEAWRAAHPVTGILEWMP